MKLLEREIRVFAPTYGHLTVTDAIGGGGAGSLEELEHHSNVCSGGDPRRKIKPFSKDLSTIKAPEHDKKPEHSKRPEHDKIVPTGIALLQATGGWLQKFSF